MRLVRRFAATGLALLGTAVFPSAKALAAEPSVAECLAAHEEFLALQAEGHLIAARGKLLACASAACPGDVRSECIARVQTINERLPTIVFEARDASGGDLAAVRVQIDGHPLSDRLDGTGLTVDPGAHRFTFEAPGHQPREVFFVLREGQRDRHEPITLDPARPATALAPPLASVREEADPAAGRRLLLRRSGVGLGIAGVAALGLGTFFAAKAWSSKTSAETLCPSSPCENREGAAGWAAAADEGDRATIAFSLGAGLAAAGVALWYFGRDPHPVRVSLAPGAATLTGTW